ALAFRSESFDAVLCQLGLMFFPDVAQALSECHRVLRAGRWMAATVWSTPERAPFVSLLAAVLSRHLPSMRDWLAPGTAPRDAERLRALVAAAGFGEISIEAETQPIAFASFEEYWEPIDAGGSPTAALYRQLPADTRAAVMAEVRAAVRPWSVGGRLVFDTE